MTPEQIILVQTSYAYLVPNAEHVVADFYACLFALDPTLCALFPADIKAQTTKFVTMLDLLVADLRQLDKLVPTIEVLGVRHAAYGATAAHSMVIRCALLEALKAELEDLWTPELQAAWTSAYTLVATMMQAAAYRAMPPTA